MSEFSKPPASGSVPVPPPPPGPVSYEQQAPEPDNSYRRDKAKVVLRSFWGAFLATSVFAIFGPFFFVFLAGDAFVVINAVVSGLAVLLGLVGWAGGALIWLLPRSKKSFDRWERKAAMWTFICCMLVPTALAIIYFVVLMCFIIFGLAFSYSP